LNFEIGIPYGINHYVQELENVKHPARKVWHGDAGIFYDYREFWYPPVPMVELRGALHESNATAQRSHAVEFF